jgi:putative lipoic acid-binding regulatory protein
MQVLDSNNEAVLTFPAEHDFKAIGPANDAFVETVVATIAALVAVKSERVQRKASPKATYWSVTVPAHVDTREQMIAVYAALQALPQVKWTL